MTTDELMKHATLSEVARLLGLSAPAVYKWKKSGVVPQLRVFQLREKKPEWFAKEQ
jgi:predicted DNA-binding transcriptional regulator AlpA